MKLRFCAAALCLFLCATGCSDSPTPLPINAPATETQTPSPILTTTPMPMFLTLAINPRVPPFDDAQLPTLYMLLTDTDNRLVQRERIASAGYPDGFAVVIAVVDMTDPAVATFATRLATIPIAVTFEQVANPQARQMFIDGYVHAVIFAWNDQSIYDGWDGLADDGMIFDFTALSQGT